MNENAILRDSLKKRLSKCLVYVDFIVFLSIYATLYVSNNVDLFYKCLCLVIPSVKEGVWHFPFHYIF